MADAPARSVDPRAARYMGTVRAFREKTSGYRERAETVEKRYEDERAKHSKARRLNIFWSNLEILKSAVYGRTPNPQIERRFGAGDITARLAAEILTRAVTFFISEEKFDGGMKAARDDWKIAGLGQCWYRYEPLYGAQLTDPQTQQPMLDARNQPVRSVDYERVCVDHVRWKHFGYWPMRRWEDVELVWRDVFLTKDAATRRLGEEAAAKLTFDVDPTADDDGRTKSSGGGDDVEKEARVVEIWDKVRRVVAWLNPKTRGAEAVLHEAEDPLRLQGFFPCPRPLFATLERNALIPIPDYYYYQDQAEQIDDATAKIAQLTKAVRVRGAYNKAAKDLEKLFKDSDSIEQLVGVDNWNHFAGQQGGLKGNIDILEIAPVLEALKTLVELRREVKNDLYEATGISDIVRGATQASETLGAQQLKSQFAGLRLQDQQADMAGFARDGLRIAAEIISEHFQEDTLAILTGLTDPDELENLVGPEALAPPQQMPAPGIGAAAPPPASDPRIAGELRAAAAQQLFADACALLKGDVLRTFKIDIETDSTVAETILADQQAIEKLMGALERVLGRMVSLQGAPALMPMFKEVLLLALRKYRVGRAIEGRVEAAIDQAIAELKAKPEGPMADPALIQQAAKMLQTYKDGALKMGAFDPAYEQTLRQLLEGVGAMGAQPGAAPPSRSSNGAAI